MSRIDARAISTEMVDLKAVANRPHKEDVRSSMRLSQAAVQPERAITARLTAASPSPAMPQPFIQWSALVNLFEEPGFVLHAVLRVSISHSAGGGGAHSAASGWQRRKARTMA